MQKTQLKIGPTLLKILLLILGIGFAFFSFMMLNLILREFEFVGLTGFIMFSVFASLAIYAGITSLRYVVVDSERRTIDIVYLWFWRTTLIESEIVGFNNHLFINNVGSYQGILIELVNGKQFQLSEFDIKNFKEIRESIAKYLPLKSDLKLNIWTSFSKYFIAFCVIFILVVLMGKMLEW